MVSLRRRKLLGLCSGVPSSFLASLPRLFDNENTSENAVHSSNPVSVHPMPLDDTKLPVDNVNDPSRGICSSDVSGSTLSNDKNEKPYISGSTSSKEQSNQLTAEQEVKREKQHRRRRMHNQEQFVMRGVYFKNMKWQAAIKVDKKQIHLGTVSSQEEAAHLYDRAAFMCGREPNFEISEKEKQELRKFTWDEFLAMTRYAISSKKAKRRHGKGAPAPAPPPSAQNFDWEGDRGAEPFSAFDDAKQEDGVSS